MSQAFVLNNRYRLTAELGRGGMAVVYKALDQELGREVAIKLLREGYATDTAFLDRFQQEARAAASLAHPNVVAIYDTGRDGQLYYLVMEYVEGRSLKARLRPGVPLPVDKALDLAIQICAGVGAAHRAGLIHCDLKPQNILLTPDGRVKVVDFGIARALEARAEREAGVVWATPQYAAPEQTQGHSLGPASDVYAIGVILYEMLTGRLPFRGQARELARQHAEEPAPSLAHWNPQVPPQVEQIVLQTLAKEPAQRYRTAAQLGHLLIEYRRTSQQVTVAQPPAPPAMRAPRPAPTTKAPARELIAPAGPDWLAWFMGALVVMMIAGLIPLWMLVVQRYTLTRPHPTPTPTAALTENAGQQVAVPNVIGLPQEEARQVLEASGLGFAVVGERYDAQVPPLHVANQNPTPDQKVDAGQVVGVILSQGPRFLSMPNVVGLPADSVEPGLKEIGLTVTRVEAWSTEPRGTVIAQTPAANALVAEGSSVTLTVSTGARLSINANLGNQVMLVAAELDRIDVPPGGTLTLTLHWRALVQMDTSYVVFVHLIRADGSILVQQDGEPRSGTYPTTRWQAGEQVRDSYTLVVPADTPPGSYRIRTGLYTPGNSQRLPVVDSGTAQVDDNSLIVQEFRVTTSP